MSVIRPRPPADPLGLQALDADGRPWEPGPLAGRLAQARAAVLAEPAGFDIARRTLADYDSSRLQSGLFAVLGAARRIRDAVDRLVIVAGGGLGPATQLLVASCCHPFHDQLSRGERGGRPRLSWLDGRSSNDELHGLLDVVAPPGRSLEEEEPRLPPRAVAPLLTTAREIFVLGQPAPEPDLLQRWAIFAADAPADDDELVEVVQILRAAAGASPHRDSCPFLAVTAPGSRLARLAQTTGCQEWFGDVPLVDTSLGLFTAAGLLPAAIAGIDVVQVLKGAAAMLLRFVEAPIESNPVLADAAVVSAASARGLPGRRFVADGRVLGQLNAWQRQVRPCLVADAAVVSRIGIGESRRNTGRIPAPVAVGGAEPIAITILLPRLDEHAIGQLFQLLILSAAVEKQLRHAV
jgi:glucose-6-phosphate isomerase